MAPPTPRNIVDAPESFLAFAVSYGRSYLAAGGPSNRLEDQIAQLAEGHGLRAEVYATPTGIFISVAKAEDHHPVYTAVGRIKEYLMNLNQLCLLEALMEDVAEGKVAPVAAIKILKASKFQKSIYTKIQKSLAAFTMGAAMSFSTFGRPWPAIMSGVISYGAFWITGPALSMFVESAIFRDFIASLFVLMAGTAAASLMGGPIDAFTIGGLILLVPGLVITTAVAELADQNFISGTAKLMKGLLTLMSIGMAYLIFHQFAPSAPLRHTLLPQGSGNFAVATACTAASLLSFSVIFQVPRKALVWAVATGLASWAVFTQFQNPQYSDVASFLASTTVGVLSLALGTRFKTPSQVYSVPGMLALLPGMLALSSFRSLVAGEGVGGIETAFKVALVAGTIVFGLFCARIPFEVASAIRRRT